MALYVWCNRTCELEFAVFACQGILQDYVSQLRAIGLLKLCPAKRVVPLVRDLLGATGLFFVFLQVQNLFFLMELKEQFEKATEDSKRLSEKPSNEVLLQLYSLYKQSTEGDAPEEGPSNPFDFVAKAKYNAWVELKGRTREDAMQAYIRLVENLQ